MPITRTGAGKPYYIKLEEDYAEFVGHKYGVAVNSGTSALHLALVAAGIGKGDEVIVPDFTMAACAFAVAYTGATPIFIDCGDDLNINPDKIWSRVTSRTKAIMAVHIYGRLCNMQRLREIADNDKLVLIEDACEAQGADIGHADITVGSFYRNKIIHAEEGGILTTNNQEYYDKAQYLKNMAFDADHTYYHAEIGYNYRMPESQAKMAYKSLSRQPSNSLKRKTIEGWYDEFLPEKYKMPKRDAVWVYDVRFPLKREELVKAVKGARYPFRPMSTMPMWGPQKVGERAEFWSKELMYLPVNTCMSKNDVKNICEIVQSIW